MGTLNDYRDREHWSFSALNQFLNICSLQYAFQRVYRLPQAFTAVSLAFGSAYHRTLEWLALTRKEGAAPTAADAGARFRDFWDRQIQEEPNVRLEEGMTRAEYGEQGAGLVEAYLQSLDPGEEVLSVSEAFAVPLVDAAGGVLEKPLVGELDCVVRQRGNVTVVDWKTSARRWPKDQADKSLQPHAYLYGYRQLHHVDVPMRFDVVVKNKTPVCEQHVTRRTSDQFHRFVELVKRIDAMIQAEHFLPSEQGHYCGGCPFQEACRAWHRQTTRTRVSLAA